MAKAKRARTAETPKPPSFYLPLRAPVFYSTVFAWWFGGLSHVSSPLRWWLVRMRHREDNVLKDQGNWYGLTAVPLNAMECGKDGQRHIGLLKEDTEIG